VDLKHTSRFAFTRDTDTYTQNTEIYIQAKSRKNTLAFWLRECIPASIAELLNMLPSLLLLLLLDDDVG